VGAGSRSPRGCGAPKSRDRLFEPNATIQLL
jgi:hypothetical protein